MNYMKGIGKMVILLEDTIKIIILSILGNLIKVTEGQGTGNVC